MTVYVFKLYLHNLSGDRNILCISENGVGDGEKWEN